MYYLGDAFLRRRRQQSSRDASPQERRSSKPLLLSSLRPAVTVTAAGTVVGRGREQEEVTTSGNAWLKWLGGQRTVAVCDAGAAMKELPPLPPPEGEVPELVRQMDQEAKAAVETIKPPPQFGELMDDTRRLVHFETFDGFRFDWQKPITPTFAITHGWWLGSSLVPGGCHYVFGATLAEDSDKLFLGRFDINRSLDGRIFYPLAKNVLAKLQLQMGQQEAIMCDFNYTGPTLAAQLVLGKGPHLGASFTQAITPRLSVGGDTVYSGENGMAVSSWGAKYSGGGGAWGCTGLYANGLMQAQYIRRVVPNRVTLGAEFAGKPLQPEQSQVSVGAEFHLKQSRYNCAIDGTGKVDVALECHISPSMALNLTGQLNHGEEKYRFGYGIQMQLN